VAAWVGRSDCSTYDTLTRHATRLPATVFLYCESFFTEILTALQGKEWKPYFTNLHQIIASMVPLIREYAVTRGKGSRDRHAVLTLIIEPYWLVFRTPHGKANTNC